MATNIWPTTLRTVASLHLDSKNPRLGPEISSRSPREILQFLYDHDKAFELAESIATRGYFPNEPLLAVKEGDQLIVVEGNRRLAALKSLRDPKLLDGPNQRSVLRLSHQISDPDSIAKVPVTLAPSRRATDQQIVGRHIGTPVRAWAAENRASFILAKLEEGYSDDQICGDLGFTTSDIQDARVTRSIADMARSIDLPADLKKKIENPRAGVFSTIKRVIDSSVGRKFLNIVADPDHGIKGSTTKGEFLRGFTRLVTDVVSGEWSSRSLNTNKEIQGYFESWKFDELPKKKRGSFVPSDIIQAQPAVSSAQKRADIVPPKRSKQLSKTVLPKDFAVRHGSNRLVEIRHELTKLKRDEFPNAGAVMLRVFLELAILDYLKRIDRLPEMIKDIHDKTKRPLKYCVPTLKPLLGEILKIAKKKLDPQEAVRVEKAITYNDAAPFTICELHGFVHQDDLPSARDIEQFWARTEPLFRLMLA